MLLKQYLLGIVVFYAQKTPKRGEHSWDQGIVSLEAIFSYSAICQVWTFKKLSDVFFRKFAPRCYGCDEPIAPKVGESSAPRLTALDKDWHPTCFKCKVHPLLIPLVSYVQNQNTESKQNCHSHQLFNIRFIWLEELVNWIWPQNAKIFNLEAFNFSS